MSTTNSTSPPTTPKLRWAIMGTSFISSVMVNAINDSDNGEVYCVASRTVTNLEKFAKKHDINVSYNDYDHMLLNPLIDIVYIGLPTYIHAEWVKKCAIAGKHILNEKSFAINAQETIEALDIVRQQKNIFCMEGIVILFLFLILFLLILS